MAGSEKKNTSHKGQADVEGNHEDFIRRRETIEGWAQLREAPVHKSCRRCPVKQNGWTQGPRPGLSVQPGAVILPGSLGPRNSEGATVPGLLTFLLLCPGISNFLLLTLKVPQEI